MISFRVNKRPVNVDVDPSTPLLWVLRDNLGLTGTKLVQAMGNDRGRSRFVGHQPQLTTRPGPESGGYVI